MTPIPDRWAQQANYDFETAKALLLAEKYLYVLFCCQQSIEKMLKGVIAERTDEPPPRIHNLVRLGEFAGISMEEVRKDFLRDLSDYYIQARYPEEWEEVPRDKAQQVLEDSQEFLSWLKSMR